ncbi:MAG: histidine kinase [Pseudomonadota bacterium]
MNDTPPKPVSAAELRQRIAEMEAERMAELMRKRARADTAMDDFVKHFMHDEISEDEANEIRASVRHAAERGEMEVMAMRFPSRLCPDHGRAINNAEDGWVETLPGKARQLYEVWKERGQPLGYRLRATIVNFPDDLPGDVGLFISWAPTDRGV